MEGSSEDVVEMQPEEGFSFIVFLLFVPTVLIVYIIPFIATIYAKKNAKKWIGYWIFVLALNYLIKPVLCYIFSEKTSSFLFLVLAVAVLYMSSNEKVNFD
jgi:hypothetical protein